MTLPKHTDWVRFHDTFEADPNKKVVGVELQLEAKDAVSSKTGVDRNPIYITDLQFQAGNQLSGWIPNTKEMLERVSWKHDEWDTVPSPNKFLGRPPEIIENVDYRWYNILGRGHRTIVVPNYLPEDWDVPILPTGFDLTLYPKEDFDVLRISTSDGVELPEEEQMYRKEGTLYQEIKEKYEEVNSEHFFGTDAHRRQEISNWENIMRPIFDNHPIHKRYTREFWVEGAAAGTEIKVHATTRTASVGGKEIPIVGQHFVNVDDTTIPIDRKKFLLAPNGTATIRIEFYKLRERSIVTYDMKSNGEYERVRKTFKYLEDAGIGYYGTVGFVQWTYGKSRI